MKKGFLITGGIVGFIIVLLLICGGTLWAHRNECVQLEERINAQYVSNKSNYDNMWKKFREMTQVTDLQAKHIKDTYMGIISGRYQDSNLLFKMVQEQNPNLDTSVYTQLQREISASRQTFDNNQKQIADIVREYNVAVKKYVILSAITGRLPKNMDDYIVTSERTQGAFDSKKDDEIKLSE